MKYKYFLSTRDFRVFSKSSLGNLFSDISSPILFSEFQVLMFLRFIVFSFNLAALELFFSNYIFQRHLSRAVSFSCSFRTKGTRVGGWVLV